MGKESTKWDGDKMDKQTKITVKINGEERPFMMEKLAAEREISAAAEEEAATEVIASFEKTPVPKRVKRMFHARVKAALFSIVLAVIVGTSFGFVVLHIVPSEKEQASFPAAVSPTFSENNETITQQPTTPLTVNVIQAGVFSEKQAAESYAKQLQASQIPAVLIGTNPTAIWVAVGADKSTLAPLVEQYKQKGLTTYVKPVALSSIQDKDVQALYAKIAALSVQLLTDSAVSETEWTSLEAQYKKATQKNERLKKAYVSLVAYRKQKEIPLLWNVQQHLLFALQTNVE